MRGSAYVGRVGGLAVALGIGAAVSVGGSGAAWASPGGDSSGASAGSAESANDSPRSGRSNPVARGSKGRVSRPAGGVGSVGARLDTAQSVADSAASLGVRGVTAAERSSVHPSASERSQHASPMASTLTVIAPQPSVAEDRVALAAPPVDTAVVGPVLVVPQSTTSASVVGLADSASPDAAAPVMAAAPAQTAAASGAVESVLAPLLGTGTDSPVQSPVSWVMLAAARRELGGPVAAPVQANAGSSVPAPGAADATPAATPNSAAAQGAAAVSDPVPVGEGSAASTVTPKDSIDITFGGLNSSIGWIPVVGTVINAVKFAIDVVSLASAVFTLNFPQIIAELGNLVVDTIGLVPVVGAPVAALLFQTVLGGNVKLGNVVQESLQSYFDVDSTWSKYQFYVEAVDVAVGLGGSQAGTATVSKPNYAGVGVVVDITNSGLETGWSVPLQGRLQLLSLAFS